MRVGSDWSTSLWMNARSPGDAHDSDDDGQQSARNDRGDGEGVAPTVREVEGLSLSNGGFNFWQNPSVSC